MSEHVTAQQIEQYRSKGMPPEDLLAFEVSPLALEFLEIDSGLHGTKRRGVPGVVRRSPRCKSRPNQLAVIRHRGDDAVRR